MSTPAETRINRVRLELSKYEHPLAVFDAEAAGGSVRVSIRLKMPVAGVDPYYFDLHPRDLDGAQFAWNFQRQLYDCLHDYFIEMFTRTPQSHDEENGK